MFLTAGPPFLVLYHHVLLPAWVRVCGGQGSEGVMLCGHVLAVVHLWRSEDNSVESVPSVYLYSSSWEQTQSQQGSAIAFTAKSSC